MTGLEYRGAAGAITEVNDSDHTFALRVVNYGVVDSYGSNWAPEVFAESLTRKMPSAAWAHDWSRIIGSMVESQERSDGLDGLVKFADFDYVPDARMAWSLLKDGHIKDTSFGFKRGEAAGDWSSTRNDSTYKPSLPGEKELLRKARLDEVSPVLVGAVPGAKTLAVRSEGRITRMDAGQILVQVATGAMDLRTALNALEDDEDHRTEEQVTDDKPPEMTLTRGDAEIALSLIALDEGMRSAGAVSHPDATERLMEYWSHGKGAAKIGWGTDGDFKRCEAELGKYVPPGEVAGLCSNLHVRATGARPGHAPGEGK